MRLNVKNLIIWLLIIAAVLTLHTVRRNSTMRGIESVVVANQPCLLTPADVDSLILSAFPSLLQTDIKRVEKKEIQQMLVNHPYVLDAEVGMSTGGKLQVKVTQRVPVVRMFYAGREFYISAQGTTMPLCTKHYCDVIVGSSDRPLHKSTRQNDLVSIWKLASFLHDNPTYDGVFDQISVNEKGDLILTPKIGDITVVVGDIVNLDDKFENLWAFYEQGVNKMGWDTYKTISLKYRGQVVAVRR